MTFIKNLFTRLLFIALYSVILIFLFKISPDELVNPRELILVIVGAALFTIPQMIEGKNRNAKTVVTKIPIGALASGTFTSIVLVVLSQNRLSFSKSIYQTVFICFRPTVYGIVLYILFAQKKISENKMELTSEQRLSDYYKSRGLSKREVEVAKLAANGLTNREIADTLFIAPTTVKRHLYVIFEKLGISRREDIKPL